MFYVKTFLDHLTDCRYSPKTIKDYRYLLNRMKRYFERRGVKQVNQITENRMGEYLKALDHRKLSGKYIYITVKRLGTYFRYLEQEGHLFLSPVGDWNIRSYPKSSFPCISESRMQQMLSGIRTTTSLSVKGKALIELAYSSALRPQELYRLKLSDIDYTKGLLFIEQSKGHKDRVVPVGRHALLWTEKYIREVRPRYIKDNTHNFVFVSHKTGKALTVWGIRWAIQQTLKRNGFACITPYSLRCSAATALLLNGMGIGYISALLGHTEIRTTQLYLHVKLHELRNELNHKHPRRVMERLYTKTTEEENDEV